MSRVLIPVKKVNGENWGDLGAFAISHDIVGEKVHLANENFSFAGGHRVRLYRFKKNVHFKIPQGTQLDIAAVIPASAPRRRTP